jgi:hypothetical protein
MRRFTVNWMSTARQSMSITKEENSNEGQRWETCHQKARKMVIVAKLSLMVWSVYLKLTPVVIQSWNAAKVNGSQPNWDAREN